MIKSIPIATGVLVAAAMSALAQGDAPQGAQHPTVIGQTGTMYDGNNANLRLPSEQNAYWAQLWAEPGASGNAGPASAVGAGAAGASLGGAQTGDNIDRRQTQTLANAQEAGATAAASLAASTLSPVDYQFVAEANLGAPFQVDSGRLGEKRAKNPAVRDYAHLMVVTHIPVVDALNTILKRTRRATPRSSRTRSRMGRIRTSRHSRARPCRRSKTICSGR